MAAKLIRFGSIRDRRFVSLVKLCNFEVSKGFKSSGDDPLDGLNFTSNIGQIQHPKNKIVELDETFEDREQALDEQLELICNEDFDQASKNAQNHQDNTSEAESKDVSYDVMNDRPKSLAYFNHRVAFTEFITAMDLCVSRYTKQIPYFAKKPTIDMIRKPEDRFMSWFSKNRMEKHVGSLLTETQYNSIIARLEQLAGDSPEDFNTLPAELQTYLLEFTHTSKVEFEKFQPKPLDNLGRAYACGRRKEATAQVWLVKGDGKVVINGRPLASYFIRMVDREDILLPFSVTSTLGKYNAWVKAYGGGTTGQAGSVRLGISKALVTHEPELHSILSQQGLLTRDPRMVERKKTNRLKARKSRTWVKR